MTVPNEDLRRLVDLVIAARESLAQPPTEPHVSDWRAAGALYRLHTAGVGVLYNDPDGLRLRGRLTPELIALARSVKSDLLALVSPRTEPEACAWLIRRARAALDIELTDAQAVRLIRATR